MQNPKVSAKPSLAHRAPIVVCRGAPGLKRRAAGHGRSTEAEHGEIFRQGLVGDVEPSFDALAADLRELTRRRKLTPSEVLFVKVVRSDEQPRR